MIALELIDPNLVALSFVIHEFNAYISFNQGKWQVVVLCHFRIQSCLNLNEL